MERRRSCCFTGHRPRKLPWGSNEEDPCAIFRKVQFPMEEFFPPNTLSQPEGYQETKSCCSKA